MAISDHRILKVEDGRVSFSYKKTGSARSRTLTLDALEFIRRFLHHVLPKGFMKVRYYGFLSPTAKVPLEDIKALVELAHGFTVTVPEIRATTLATTDLSGLRGTTPLPQLTAHPPPPIDATNVGPPGSTRSPAHV